EMDVPLRSGLARGNHFHCPPRTGIDSPSMKWSDLKDVFWHQGGPINRGRSTSSRRLSRSCGRLMSWSRRPGHCRCDASDRCEQSYSIIADAKSSAAVTQATNSRHLFLFPALTAIQNVTTTPTDC